VDCVGVWFSMDKGGGIINNIDIPGVDNTGVSITNQNIMIVNFYTLSSQVTQGPLQFHRPPIL